MALLLDGVWNNDKIRVFLKAPARRGRGFGIWESGINDVAFSEAEMGLQGQRYDLMMLVILVLICLFVLSMIGFRPCKGVCPTMFSLQAKNVRAVAGTTC